MVNRNGRKEEKRFRGLYIVFHTEDRKSGIWVAEGGEDLLCVLLLLSSDWNDEGHFGTSNCILSSEAELGLGSSSLIQYREDGVSIVW